MYLKTAVMGSCSNLCGECNRSFSRFSNLRRHAMKFHKQKLNEIAPVEVKSYAFPCTYYDCKKKFSHRRNMIMHLKTHAKGNVSTSKENFRKKCPLCDFAGKLKDEFYSHYEMEHDVTVDIEELTFSSIDEFRVWLANTESESQEKFILEKGLTSTKASYICHRSGFFISRSTGQRHLKTQQTKKINGFCPAGLQVSVDKENACYLVTFVKTHVGHQNKLIEETCYENLECNELEDDHQLLGDDHQLLEVDQQLLDAHQLLEDDHQLLDDPQLLEDDQQLLEDDQQLLEDDQQLLEDDQHLLEDDPQLEIAETPREPKSQLIFDLVSTREGNKPLSGKKKEWLQEISRLINSIQCEKEFAAVETCLNMVGTTLKALQKVRAAHTQEPHNENILPERMLFSTITLTNNNAEHLANTLRAEQNVLAVKLLHT